jgi:hypothetical protein
MAGIRLAFARELPNAKRRPEESAGGGKYSDQESNSNADTQENSDRRGKALQKALQRSIVQIFDPDNCWPEETAPGKTVRAAEVRGA